MASVGGTEIVKKAAAYASSLKLGRGAGMLGKHVMNNMSKLGNPSAQVALAANAAIGAVGGGLYGYATNRDWKGGATQGAFAGAGMWSVGGLRGLRAAGRASGLRKSAPRAAASRSVAKAAEQATAAEAAAEVINRRPIGVNTHGTLHTPGRWSGPARSIPSAGAPAASKKVATVVDADYVAARHAARQRAKGPDYSSIKAEFGRENTGSWVNGTWVSDLEAARMNHAAVMSARRGGYGYF